MKDNTKESRRGFLRAVTVGGSLLSSGRISMTTVSAQPENRLEASNSQLRIRLDNIDSKTFISAFNVDGENLFRETKTIHPKWGILSLTETVNSTPVTADGWDGYRTVKRYEYEGSDETSEPSSLRIIQTTSVPSNEPIGITQLEITNESENTTVIRRPDSNIHDGWVVSRLPPLRNPSGTYRYHIEDKETRIFDEGDLWDATDLTGDQQFITYFGSNNGITTKYLDGPTEPHQSVTITTADADVDDKSSLPQSEDNRPARQTPGFSIDAVDLAVERFSIKAGETVSFAIASMAHTGGSEAVTRAEELSQEAESLWENMPSLQEVSENSGSSGLVTRFQQFSDEGSLLPGIAVLGGAATLGIVAYRRFSDSGNDIVDQNNTTSQVAPDSATEPTGEDSEPVFQDAVYDDYERNGHLRSTSHLKIDQAVNPSNQGVVALYSAAGVGRKTIDASILDQIVDGFNTWNSVDDHEQIFTVYTYGDTPTPWAVVELADDAFDPGDFADESLITKQQLIIDLCNGIHEGHRYGLAHGHIDTSTFVVEADGEPSLKIGDWGVTDAAITDTADQQTDIEQVVDLAFELFTGESASIDNPESVNYPGGLKSVFETMWENDGGYETVIHFRDAITEAV